MRLDLVHDIVTDLVPLVAIISEQTHSSKPQLLLSDTPDKWGNQGEGIALLGVTNSRLCATAA